MRVAVRLNSGLNGRLYSHFDAYFRSRHWRRLRRQSIRRH